MKQILAKPITPYTMRGGVLYEQVALIDMDEDCYLDGFCIGVVHIDFFYKDRALYEKLKFGNTVTVQITAVPDVVKVTP